MPRPLLTLAVSLLCALAGVSAAQTLPPVTVLTESPWNGDWVLSQTRNPRRSRRPPPTATASTLSLTAASGGRSRRCVKSSKGESMGGPCRSIGLGRPRSPWQFQPKGRAGSSTTWPETENLRARAA